MARISTLDTIKIACAVAAVASLAIALGLPSTAAGGASLIILAGVVGAAVAWFHRDGLAELPAWATRGLVVTIIACATAQLFGGVWQRGGFKVYDWGPHHAILSELVASLRDGGHVPRWVQGVSTGDSPYELYPWLPYYLAAKAAILTDTHDLTLVLVRSGILVHGMFAVGCACLALRVVAWPGALLVGLVVLHDRGSVWGGGIDGILGMGVTHSALANAIWPFVLTAVIDALERPRLRHSIRIWLLVGFAIACHPVGLINALATSAALLLVALLAEDVAPRRALGAAGQIAIGVAIIAMVWMPLGERLVLYGVHFAVAPPPIWRVFEDAMRTPMPETGFAPMVYAGYAGLLAALVSRRAVPTLIAAFAGVLLAGVSDQLYLLLDLAPSLEVSRFQPPRLGASAKVGIYISAAYLLALGLRSRIAPPKTSTRLILGALLGALALGLVRGATPFVDNLRVEFEQLAQHEVPDPEGFRALIAWAREQQRAMRPQQFARLLHQDDKRYYSVYHLHAESGLPALWLGPVSNLFLRERIEDESARSLRRFNIRWVMRRDAPPSLGEPGTELQFGHYFVRELLDWDGRFARVEQGRGEAIVSRLENERVDVELRATDKPALVALGMGYYPRWQAEHAGRPLPVYAMPSIKHGKLQIVAAWVPPGLTTFRPTGSLPSDASGRIPALVGASFALAFCVLGVWRSARMRVLRAVARCTRRAAPHRRSLGACSAIAALAALAIAGVAAQRAPARALQLGNGARGTALVEARTPGGAWRRCDYSWARGGYRCPELLFVQDVMGKLLNDAQPSPPFAVPAIELTALGGAAEFRIRLDAKLQGEYWTRSSADPVALTLADGSSLVISKRQQTERFPDSAESRVLTIQGAVKRSAQIACVQRKRSEPERGYPTVPPRPAAEVGAREPKLAAAMPALE
jgi:hypothetical protein